MTFFTAHYNSPLGGMTMASDGQALAALWFDGTREEARFADKTSTTKALPVFDETRRWLDLYFAGEQPDFVPLLAPKGPPFRRKVWDVLLTIPYGETRSYGEIAQCISPKMSAQAVGGAVGSNPIGLIIPCHRVIGADGSLTGYGGGLDRKRWLLELECPIYNNGVM
jgi:methylated-DNA-[protein]-cysteine S-methyltransferase